ncbi:MBL fold metallo-hydrolase [Heliorestis convoluta]|uniref:MBL fold metallo-hydrolase n=1 Tax=Heliorestis convoluta TaxID=356322 RepID=A0A5Q2MZR1_9FIRM|nr:MBL fold metallo-hydrolase [Heliorestis convoluta]QGG47531.1 MBL fold metallo-hydrolase [Heliorestis convoluta]
MLGPIIGIILLLLFAAVAILFLLPKYRPTAAMLALNVGREFTGEVKKPPHLLTIPMGPDDDVTIGWVGHSTWVLEMQGKRLITDPIFSERAVFPKRLVAPALQPDQIDSLDYILLSHAHYDHLDIASLQALPDEAILVLPEGDGQVVKDLRQKKVTLKANDTYRSEDLTIKTFKAEHEGKRAMGLSSNLTLVYLIEKGDSSIVYVGDSGYSPELAEQVRQARPDGIDCAIVPIAAYKPEEFHDDHCNPEEALKMAQEMGARFIVPMHHETFVLSLESIDEPRERFKKAAREENLTEQAHPLPIGGTLTIKQGREREEKEVKYH